jgi:TonB family protein
VVHNQVILRFVLLSAAAHTLAFVAWPASTPAKTRISATLSVGFTALEPSARSPAPSPTAKSTQPAKASAAVARTRSAPVVTSHPIQAKRHNGRRKTHSTLATTPTQSARRLETATADAYRAQQATEAPHTLVGDTAPVTARPWEPAWGSGSHYSAANPKQTANSASALLRTQPQQSPPAPKVPNKAATSEATRALIRGHLETDLSRYFSYPPIARQRGWQGHVRVAFTVQADGQLTGARITHSSGYHILDASALEALHRVGRLPQAREWLHGQALTMELPVVYRLEN